MKTTKWYNWVGDDVWDEYCKAAWLFCFIPCGSLLLLLIVAAIVGYDR